MKRLLTLLLLFATPCSADVLVVDHRGESYSYNAAKFRDTVLGVLEKYGATYAYVTKLGITTAQCRTGTLTAGGHTRTFQAVVHLNCDINTLGGGGSPANWNQLTLQSLGWPSVPQVFFGAPTAGASMWTQTASCSTGVSGYAAAYPTGLNWYTQYLAGTPLVWKSPAVSTQVYHLAPVGSAGIFRAVVRDGPSQASRRISTTSTVNNVKCTDCDSTGFGSGDSVLVWARYRSSAETVPLFFCASHTGGAGDPFLIKMTLAMADSVTGGQVFENRSLLPRKRALWIKHGFSRGRYDAMTNTNGGGTFCAADSCDSANVIAGIDSLASLNIPFTVGVEADSIMDQGALYGQYGTHWAQGYPNEQAWWARAPLARFGIETYSGTSGVRSGTGTTGYGLGLHDPLGYTRARNMLPRGLTSLPPSDFFADVIANNDSSVYSLTRAYVERMKYVFGSKFVRAIWPAYNDYSPVSDTRASSPKTQDTLAYVLHHAGIRAVIFNPLEPTGNVNRGGYNIGSGWVQQGSGTSPRGWWAHQRYLDVPSSIGSTTIVGRIKLLGARCESGSLHWGFSSGHDIKEEFEAGFNRDNWYPDWTTLGGGGLPYYHDFTTPLSVIAFSAQELGGAGQGTTPTRKAYFQTKWMANAMKAVDALMIPGKKLDIWAYADEVVP